MDNKDFFRKIPKCILSVVLYKDICKTAHVTSYMEYRLMPQDTASENQFCFRKDCETSCAISLLNDTAAYTKTRSSQLYVCRMDA